MSDPNKTQLGAAPSVDPNKTMMGAPPSLNATATIKPIQCPVCKTFNPAAVMFCIECGLIFEKALPADAFGAPAVQLPTLVASSGREHPIRPGANSIGREGDIQLDEPKVSRRHAQIVSEGGALVLEDLGSTNGTKLNGQPLAVGEKRPLSAGDTVSFGGVELRVQSPGATPGTATQMPVTHKTAAMAAPPQVEAPPARLVGEGCDFPLKAGINSFGRKAENDVQIAEPYVSGKHGLIEIAEDGAYLTDVGSTNGTMLNDAKLVPNMRTRVTADDVIRLGSLELRVVIDG